LFLILPAGIAAGPVVEKSEDRGHQ